MKTELDPTHQSRAEGVQHFDVVIVGAGFSGCYLLYQLRKNGFNCCVIEAAEDLGGVWQWNRYPGARVDTHAPLYQLSIPEVWQSWNWTQRFPAAHELVAYFQHLDKVLDLRKDVIFNTKVVGAEFSEDVNTWTITTGGGATFVSRYFIPAMGFAAKRVFPDWPGIERFKGEIHHSSFWPKEGVDVQGKRVAVVGTGSTGVQMTQEMGKSAGFLTVFQRTPNYCLPLPQEDLTPDGQASEKAGYAAKFALRTLSAGGYDFCPEDVNTFDHTSVERAAMYERKWSEGGFQFWSGAYKDLMTNKVANREAYDFWASKVRGMIRDPVKKDLLAPLEPPHPFGTRRTALFTTYYDVLNQDNVCIVPVKENPIELVTESGVVTKDGKHHELDVIALATGFDAVTGGLNQIVIKNAAGLSLRDKWARGTKTYLGLMSSGFPNMFFVYGPQGPTALSNGPTCIEMQSNWIVQYLVYAREKGLKRIDAKPDSEDAFSKVLNEHTNQTLFITDDSPYVGANVKGKVREGLNWIAGVPEYHRLIVESAAKGYRGFELC
jgi:cation diffusion facilitator CzcD-associated flavoprotein CzcO